MIYYISHLDSLSFYCKSQIWPTIQLSFLGCSFDKVNDQLRLVFCSTGSVVQSRVSSCCGWFGMKLFDLSIFQHFFRGSDSICQFFNTSVENQTIHSLRWLCLCTQGVNRCFCRLKCTLELIAAGTHLFPYIKRIPMPSYQEYIFFSTSSYQLISSVVHFPTAVVF